MSRPRILIVKTGNATPEIVASHGDYHEWFTRAMGEPERFDVARCVDGEQLPDTDPYEGVIITGSSKSVCVPEPWMDRLAERLLREAGRGKAILGVCFGHQLLGHAFGTPVVKNLNGREIGTIEVELTEEGQGDPLFAGLGPTLRVHATHSDVLRDLPRGAVLLGGNENTAVQAMRFGERVHAVQFHPELNADAVRQLISARAHLMRDEGLDPEATAEQVRPTIDGVKILSNFEAMVLGQRPEASTTGISPR